MTFNESESWEKEETAAATKRQSGQPAINPAISASENISQLSQWNQQPKEENIRKWRKWLGENIRQSSCLKISWKWKRINKRKSKPGNIFAKNVSIVKTAEEIRWKAESLRGGENIVGEIRKRSRRTWRLRRGGYQWRRNDAAKTETKAEKAARKRRNAGGGRRSAAKMLKAEKPINDWPAISIMAASMETKLLQPMWRQRRSEKLKSSWKSDGKKHIENGANSQPDASAAKKPANSNRSRQSGSQAFSQYRSQLSLAKKKRQASSESRMYESSYLSIEVAWRKPYHLTKRQSCAAEKRKPRLSQLIKPKSGWNICGGEEIAAAASKISQYRRPASLQRNQWKSEINERENMAENEVKTA